MVQSRNLAPSSRIWAFPPGCYQIFDIHDGTKEKEFPTRRYWDFPPVRNNKVSSDEAALEIRNKLDFSVRDHLVSDVPIGVFLSSGLDSTTIAGLA
jgi:asparagine synthase (glutamine-hydrolysing)